MVAPHHWSRTAANNGSADPNADLRPDRSANTVLGAIRGLMATAALARDDGIGTLVATLGANNVYSLFTNESMIDPAVSALTPTITAPFLLRVVFGNALTGVVTDATTGITTGAPKIKVDGAAAVPLVRGDGSALANGDLSTTAPVLILGDFAAAGDTTVTRVRILNQTPGELSAFVSANAPGLPVGTLIQRSGRGLTVPTGYLLANGALVSRATYADLWAYAQAENFVTSEASWPGNTPAFSSGDGSTTFRIPDLRGEFLRGLDLGRGVDPGRDAAVVQADAFRYHQHQTVTDGGLFFMGGGIQYFQNGAGQASHANEWSTGGAGGSETRPRNAAAPIFIKY